MLGGPERKAFGVVQATSCVQRPDSSAAASEWHILDNATFVVSRH